MTQALTDPYSLSVRARQALTDGRERELLPALKLAATRLSDPALFQWAGLLHRALDELQPAMEAFDAAARLAPDDALIALSRARVALEAGRDARKLFDRAIRIMPSGDAFLGKAAAQYAAGQGVVALDELSAILASNPGWIDGHVQWSQLASMTGQAARATETIERAIRSDRSSIDARLALIDILTKGARHVEAAAAADDAINATGQPGPFTLRLASALSDSAQLDRAASLFAALGEPTDVHHAVHLARLYVRQGRVDALVNLSNRWMAGDNAHHFWPYASIAWRLASDPRWQWLEGDSRLVQVVDLSARLGALEPLGRCLHDIHSRSGRFLDQSVRGGTQTDGALLSRLEPEIQDLRSAIVSAVEEYRAQLPPHDPYHPMLRHRRDGEVRFAGSWSVRLRPSGHHSHHIHPAGWISSAFYVETPDDMADGQGWLTLGEPQSELGLTLPPILSVRPQPGLLVLFPSMMWHGTNPFASGERMTAAFDVAPPR